MLKLKGRWGFGSAVLVNIMFRLRICRLETSMRAVCSAKAGSAGLGESCTSSFGLLSSQSFNLRSGAQFVMITSDRAPLLSRNKLTKIGERIRQ